jgi:subtilisin family serine protease
MLRCAKRGSAAGLGAALALLALPAGAQTPAQLHAARANAEPLGYLPDQVLVRLDPSGIDGGAGASVTASPTPGLLGSLLGELGVVRSERIHIGRSPSPAGGGAGAGASAASAATSPDLHLLFRLDLAPGSDVPKAVAALSARPEVAYAEPNYLYSASATPLPAQPYRPNDPFVSTDGANWSEGAVRAEVLDQYGLERMRVLEAFQHFDTNRNGSFDAGERKPGEGVVVAVIDSGVDFNHPELAPNIWENPNEIRWNYQDDDENGFPDDVIGWDFIDHHANVSDGNGHGTHVAGTIAALADNGVGIAGVAPWAKIMILRGLSDDGRGSSEALAASIVYAVDNGADILSNSWGGLFQSNSIREAFEYASARGVLSLAAAGNGDVDVRTTSPANLPQIVAVAALDRDDTRAPFSNYGLGIGISAPGVRVLSLNANGGNNFIARLRPEFVIDELHLALSGTSMACPHAAGVAALLMSAFPNETADEIRGRLLAGGNPLDALNPGFERRLGRGRASAADSLAATPSPIVTITEALAPELVPGSATELLIDLRNDWSGVAGLSGRVTTQHPLVSIPAAESGFGDLPIASIATNELTPFRLTLDPAIPLGERIPLELALEAPGYSETLPIELRVTLFQDISRNTALPLLDFIPSDAKPDDWNGDGRLDLFFVGWDTQALFEQQLDGSFLDVNASSRLGNLGGLSVFRGLPLDSNRDGLRDLFVGRNAVGSLFFEGQSTGGFRNASLRTGLRDVDPREIVAVDCDLDGWTDLVGFGDTALVLRNQGDGSYANVAEDSPDLPVPPLPSITHVVVLDADRDGFSDLAVAGFNTGPMLFRGLPGCRFEDRSVASGVVHPARLGFGVAAGDFDNDLDVDLFFTSLGLEFNENQRSALLRNRGDGSFEDVTLAAGGADLHDIAGMNGGVEFFDFDNDGDLDLYVTNALTSRFPDNQLFRNDAGHFTRIADFAFPAEVAPGGAIAAVGDFDSDGSLDIFAPTGVLGLGGKGALLRNLAGRLAHWIAIELAPTASNPDALGARVRVRSGGRDQLRELHSGTHAVQPAHFGLGAAAAVDEIEVRWPSGRVQTLAGVAADQKLVISECDDADSDGSCDAADNCVNAANRDQLDADADGFGNACDADYDQSGSVQMMDFVRLRSAFNSSAGDARFDAVVDHDGSGNITIGDFLRFRALFGAGVPGPSGLDCAGAAPCP